MFASGCCHQWRGFGGVGRTSWLAADCFALGCRAFNQRSFDGRGLLAIHCYRAESGLFGSTLSGYNVYPTLFVSA